MKRTIARLALVIGGTILALCMAEGVLRLHHGTGIGMFMADPPLGDPHALYDGHERLGFVPRPGAVMTQRTIEFTTETRFNALGTRGPELEPPRDDTTVILAVGDSFTLGSQVAEHDCFTSRLQQTLGEATGRRVRVINAGVDGYNTFQATHRARELVERYPVDALVLTFFLGNDFMENTGAMVPGGLHGIEVEPTPPPDGGGHIGPMPEPSRLLPKPAHDWLFMRSHLYTQLELWHRALTARQTFYGDRWREEMSLFTAGSSTEEQLFPNRLALEQLGEFCTARQLPCLVSLAPPAFTVDPDRVATSFSIIGVEGEPDLERLPRELLGLMPATLRAHDLAPELIAAAEREPVYYEFDGHWNPAGHRAVAEALTPILAELLADDE